MTWLAAEANTLADNPFTQLGALVIMAGIGLWFIRREAARADRLEEKYDKLSEGIRETVIPALNQHAAAIEQALEVLRDVRRFDERRNDGAA